MSKVLVVEDDPSLREGLLAVIASLGHSAVGAASLAEARANVAGAECVLLDIRLKDGDGLTLLPEIKQIPVIVVTAYSDSERTIRAMRDGAFDYVTKPFDLAKLKATIMRALKQRALVRELPKQSAAATHGLIGTSAAMLNVWKLIGRAAASRAPVLITGETGSGKEMVARAIHAYSEQASEPFVAVNLAALPATLLESELFGHEKGAFTGATARRQGRMEQAASGTLFLDEIGDLDGTLQTKLLRVLQDGGFERVGGNEALQAHARIISATNKPMAALREDLYYRLAVIEIAVPALRERRSDIPLLVSHALAKTSARAVSEEAMARLISFDWPGNVRELFHLVERAAALCGGEVIDVADLPDQQSPTSAAPEEIPQLHLAVEALERKLIVRALQQAEGNRSEAARILGIGRALLYTKIEQYKLT